MIRTTSSTQLASSVIHRLRVFYCCTFHISDISCVDRPDRSRSIYILSKPDPTCHHDRSCRVCIMYVCVVQIVLAQEICDISSGLYGSHSATWAILPYYSSTQDHTWYFHIRNICALWKAFRIPGNTQASEDTPPPGTNYSGPVSSETK